MFEVKFDPAKEQRMQQAWAFAGKWLEARSNVDPDWKMVNGKPNPQLFNALPKAIQVDLIPTGLPGHCICCGNH